MTYREHKLLIEDIWVCSDEEDYIVEGEVSYNVIPEDPPTRHTPGTRAQITDIHVHVLSAAGRARRSWSGTDLAAWQADAEDVLKDDCEQFGPYYDQLIKGANL